MASKIAHSHVRMIEAALMHALDTLQKCTYEAPGDTTEVTENQCNCDQARAAERRATIALESLAAIKRTLQSDMGPDQKLNWIGSIVQLALANAARVPR